MNATRTDIHRPSAEEFDPETYALISVFDLDPTQATGEIARRQATVARLLTEGKTLAGIHPLGQCEHCGAHLRYAALLLHTPSNQLLFIGETCLEGRFEATREQFTRLRKMAALRRRAEQLPQRARDLIESHPSLAELAQPGSEVISGSHFLERIAAQFLRSGRLSPRQVEVAVKLIRQRREWAAQRAEAEAKRETQRIAAVDADRELPVLASGRVTVTGTIRETRWQPSADGGYPVMIVTAEGELAGYTVHTTLPRSLRPKVITPGWLAQIGTRRVSFEVELKPGRAKGYAFGSRPSKAQYLD